MWPSCPFCLSASQLLQGELLLLQALFFQSPFESLLPLALLTHLQASWPQPLLLDAAVPISLIPLLFPTSTKCNQLTCKTCSRTKMRWKLASPKQKTLEPHGMIRECLSTHHFKHLPFLLFLFPLNQDLACQQFLMFFFNNDFKLKKWLALPGGPVMCRWLNHTDSTGI